VGHVLGFADHNSGNDIMTTSLSAGMRRLPEAVTSTSNSAASAGMPGSTGVSAAASPAITPTVVLVGNLGLAQPTAVREGATPAAVVGPTANDAVFSAAVQGFSPAAIVRGLPLSVAAPAAVLPSNVPPPAPVSTGTDRNSSGVPAPGVRPPGPIAGGAASDDNSEGLPAPTPAGDSTDALMLQRANDTCFADDSWAADQAESSAPIVNAAAAAALILTLERWNDAGAAATVSRKRQLLLNQEK
jgi:hypothetical protein